MRSMSSDLSTSPPTAQTSELYPKSEPTNESISSQSNLGFSLILEQFANKVFSALSDFPTTYSWFARNVPLKLITVLICTYTRP